MARDMLKAAEDEDSIAGFYLVLKSDGRMKYDGCGETRRDLVWALEKMKAEVIGDTQ